MTPKRRTQTHTHRIYFKAECEEQGCTWAVGIGTSTPRVDDAHDRARRHTLETGHKTYAVGEVELEYRPEVEPA
jgi:hypothetical protein